MQADILLQSREVKLALIERCNLLQIDIRDLAKHCKIDEHKLTLWTNGVLPEEMLESVSQEQVIRMLSVVGISVKVHLISLPVSKMSDEAMITVRSLQK